MGREHRRELSNHFSLAFSSGLGLLIVAVMLATGCSRQPTPTVEKLWREGKLDEAIAECRNLTSREEADLHTHKLLAFLLLQRAERDEAGGTYEGARSVTFAEAIQAANKAFRLDTEDAESHMNLGVAYVKAASYLDVATAPDLAPFHDLIILSDSRAQHLKSNRSGMTELFLGAAALHFRIASGSAMNPWRKGTKPQVAASPDIRRQAASHLERLVQVTKARQTPRRVETRFRYQSDNPEREPAASGAEVFAEDGKKLAEAMGTKGRPLYLPPEHCRKLAEAGGLTRLPTGGAWEFTEKHFDEEGKTVYEGKIRFDEFTGEKIGEEPIEGGKKTEFFRVWAVHAL